MFKVDTCCHLDLSWFVWIRVWNVSCWKTGSSVNITLLFSFFCVRLLSIMRGHSMFKSPPQQPMKDFLSQILSITFIFLSLLLSKIQCSALNKWTTGTIFITSLVWRGPWLRIEPGTSRTRNQYSTTWLTRRRLYNVTETYVIGFANLS